ALRWTIMSAIILFYRGSGGDHRGRRLDDILAWEDEMLEAVHDFIQWLFPLDEPSGANASAPVLTPDDIETFRREPALRDRLRDSLKRMLAFYGFALHEDGSIEITRDRDFDRQSAGWLTPYNHNFLRLTRIMK